MSAPGRPKREALRAWRVDSPIPAPGRPMRQPPLEETAPHTGTTEAS